MESPIWLSCSGALPDYLLDARGRGEEANGLPSWRATNVPAAKTVTELLVVARRDLLGTAEQKNSSPPSGGRARLGQRAFGVIVAQVK